MDFNGSGLIRAETEGGVCLVHCFAPNHHLTLATMRPDAVCRVVDTWIEQILEIGSRPNINYVQIFENRGKMMGASNPHPHAQIWATEHVPNEPACELIAQCEYLTQRGVSLLTSYLALELKEHDRIVFQTDSWVALVPFWAVWPYELLVLPRRRAALMEELSDSERDGLSHMLQVVTRAYNRVFETPFPYSMGVHTAPCDGEPHPEWHLHFHFYPPLLRSAAIRKFMVGFELLGSPQRDITPEFAAESLRKLISVPDERECK
jgi:UDPglucose--hexose-1-phosphate uridylyltransferase